TNAALKEELRKIRNKWRNKVRYFKQRHTNEILRQVDTSNIWKILKKSEPAHTRAIPTIDGASSFEEKCEKFWKLFPTPTTSAQCPTLQPPMADLRTEQHEITTVDITNALRRCNLSGAPGYDGVIYNAISKVHQSQPQLLTGLYNACLTVGHYPTAWKHAICVLIPKPGRDPSLIKAYRPISLLPNIGKILENILALKLT